MGNGLQQEDPLRLLLEESAVISAINRLFRSTDERDWEAVDSCFAPTVRLDMTSLTGGEPETTTPASIVESWNQALSQLEAVHHQAGNYEVFVTGTRARASCYGTAFHYHPNESGRNVRRFVGTYDFGLHKRRGQWCVDMLRYNVKFVDGNLDLEGSGSDD